MKRTHKRSNKLEKPIPDIAQSFADQFISRFGIADAERIALLVLEKIRANKKSLEGKYGKE